MSRIERILQAIIDGTSYNEAPQSRIEEILLAIKNDTDYLKSPYSRVETLLLAIKDNTDYSDLLQSRIEEILEHKLHNTVYEKDALSRIEKLLIDWISKADYYELIGIPPLTFVSNGENLVDYTIYGAAVGVGDKTDNLFYKTSEMDISTSWVGAKFYPNNPVSIYYFVFFSLPEEIKTILKSESNISAKVFLKKQGSYFKGMVLDITPEIMGSIPTEYRVLQNDGTTLDFTKDMSDWDDIYISLGYGQGIIIPTSGIDRRAQIIRAFFDNFDLSITAGTTTPESFEPYGYKIPIICGGTITNIYLDKPLRENESISMSDTGVSIPTINGSNTLSIGTTVQPSNVYLKYKGG